MQAMTSDKETFIGSVSGSRSSQWRAEFKACDCRHCPTGPTVPSPTPLDVRIRNLQREAIHSEIMKAVGELLQSGCQVECEPSSDESGNLDNDRMTQRLAAMAAWNQDDEDDSEDETNNLGIFQNIGRDN